MTDDVGTTGFGLAPVKREGWYSNYNGRITWSPLDKEYKVWFNEKYSKYPKFIQNLISKVTKEAWDGALYERAKEDE